MTRAPRRDACQAASQPPMPRAFWKGSVQKMQQKYGAPIPDEQVEAVVDYLTKNYGVSSNGASAVTTIDRSVPATVTSTLIVAVWPALSEISTTASTLTAP